MNRGAGDRRRRGGRVPCTTTTPCTTATAAAATHHRHEHHVRVPFSYLLLYGDRQPCGLLPGSGRHIIGVVRHSNQSIHLVTVNYGPFVSETIRGHIFAASALANTLPQTETAAPTFATPTSSVVNHVPCLV